MSVLYTRIHLLSTCLFGVSIRRLEQKAKKYRDTPSLEPSNFIDSPHGANQAAIPQHVNRPTKQKAQKDNSCKTNNNSSKKFSKFHDNSFLN
jgi:hypothetical protein